MPESTHQLDNKIAYHRGLVVHHLRELIRLEKARGTDPFFTFDVRLKE